ncbi:hypothetical protein BC835DRAFT_1356945 [Cytidiella melzeri]|nr:hypothetical protein BC835DRAFT_1356945 [Cytidiella melzeri]
MSHLEPAIADLVRRFNALPRPTRIASGRGDNKWVVDLRLVPLPPPGNLLLFVSPFSRYQHCEGPIPVDTRPLNPQRLQERADDVAILMLKAFVSGMGAPEMTPTAPWEWATVDEALRGPLQISLKRLGVRSELCVVKVATPAEKKIADEEFMNLMQTLLSIMRQTVSI